MLRSMTGYARKSGNSVLGSFVIEIHSINRKGLDLSISLPKELLCFDPDLRKLISSVLERGQVTLRCTFTDLSLNLQSDISSLQMSKEGWEKICTELSWEKSQVTLPFLLTQMPQVFTLSSEQEALIGSALQKTVQETLSLLISMKEREGALLVNDFHARLSLIENDLSEVEKRKGIPIASYEKKMGEKLAELQLLDEEGKLRLMKEVALLAEKLDVTEEIVRLKAHLHQFKEYLSQSVFSKGRTLDFLTQEMLREINTIGSKLQVKEVSHAVIRMKSELEKMREQVQNIE